MKTIAIILLSWNAWIFPAFPSVAGDQGPAGQSEVIKEQAGRMGQALISGDYKTFVRYTYPGLITIAGGADKLTEQLSRLMNDMKRKGMEFKSVSFGAVSKIVTSGHEQQCTLPQHTEIVMQDGRVVTTSTLIGLSSDGGRNWTFVDTSNKDMATIRKLLPGLSNAIVIPPAQPPVRYSN
jgi:hypothetical protein